MPDDAADKGKTNADQGTKDQAAGAQGQKGQEGAPSQPNVVTMDFLKGWGDAQARKSSEQISTLAAQLASMKEEFTKTIETLKPALPPDDQADAKKKSQAIPELVEVRKELEGTRKRIAEYEKQLQEAKDRERNFRFTTRVKEALNRAGCLKTELAFRMIQPDLKLDDSGDRVFTTVEMEGQPVELDVEKYVETVVKEKLAPEFFSGTVRPGSPASGGGSAGKDYDFTEEQIADSEFYAQHRDAVIKALEAGRVRKRQR